MDGMSSSAVGMADELATVELGSHATSAGAESASSDASPAAVSPALPGAPAFPESDELPVEAEGSFLWRLDRLSALPPKQYSPTFRIGSHSWRLLVYPQGNEPYEGQACSLYLAIDERPPPEAGAGAGAGAEGEREREREDEGEGAGLDLSSPASASSHAPSHASSHTPAPDWFVCAQIILTVQNPQQPEICVSKYTQHRFDGTETDWGFGQFCSLKALLHGDVSTQGTPLAAEDAVVVLVRMRIIRDVTGVLWHSFVNYNSKKVTGYVGLANQGATCYMNSLLQSLYFTNYFRKAIYMIPTENDQPSQSNALALQRIFWRLEHSQVPVSTQELTQSFGWDSLESFIQSDVQEFSRVLLDDLENRTKKTKAEGCVEHLFVGKVQSVIRCLNVPFESKRTESFYDLQLTIKGLANLEESFENYVRVEKLDGDNKYHAEGHGLQDAEKFVQFEQFPPVLHLHLERYTFDPRVMGTVKINDRLEFPLKINLDKYLAPDSPDRGKPQDYTLQSVFVHSGDSHGGHYYVFIRDPRNNSTRWHRFDDTKVIPATQKEAVEDNFGGGLEEEAKGAPPVYSTRIRDKYKRFTNAYMLVYIRDSDLGTVLCDINPDLDVPAHIGGTIRASEEAERLRKFEKQEQMMTVKVYVLTDAHLLQHTGFDFFNFDNRNHPITPHALHKVRRDEPLSLLKQAIAREMGVDKDAIRLWTFALRRNKTIRLDEPLLPEDEHKMVGQFNSRASQLPHFVLYAEASTVPYQATKCITFKFYDPEKSQLQPVGKLYVRGTETLDACYDRLCDLVGLPPNVSLDFFEEIKPSRIDQINPHKTFEENQLQTGDIICFQLTSPVLAVESRLPKVTDYFRELQNMVYIELKAVDGREIVETRISIKTPFEEIVQAVGEKLNEPASHIRLLLGDELGENPTPLKARAGMTLEEVLSTASVPSNVSTEGVVLYCEQTSVPVSELDSMKRIRLGLLTDLCEEPTEECHVHIDMHDTPLTVLDRLPEKMQATLKPNVRILETHHHRIIRDYIEDDLLASIGETSQVYIEGGVPDADLDPPVGHFVISVFSYWREPTRVHSIPFRLLLLPSEPFGQTRVRLLAQMGLSAAEAEKWTFSIVAYGRARSIADDEVLASAGLGAHDQLGINRPDPTAPVGLKSGPISSGIERSIKIRSSPANKP